MIHTIQGLYREHKKIAKIILAVLVLLVAVKYLYNCVGTEVCGTPVLDRLVREEVVLPFPQKVLTVEVVNTRESRELGLSNRKGISGNDGMLFTFPFPGRYTFWMKDMLFPIDMIWINKEGVVVHIVSNAKPEDYPATYSNNVEALYVLEIGAGKAVEYGIYLGTKVHMPFK